ncbi:hypothetical protein DFH08DRAFT_617149, partial [Mycena albidolilacea]
SPRHTDLSKSRGTAHVQRPLFLQIIWVALHLGLIGIHVALLLTGLRRWEHSLIFTVGKQTTVSFWVTALTTTIGTVYGSILVFLAQKSNMYHNGRVDQTLTAAHDGFASWAGLGSAVATLYSQLSVPASVFGTLNIVGYLACIAVLHITTPAIISVQPFNNTQPHSQILTYYRSSATRDFMTVFPSQFLPWIGNLDSTQTLGLFNGSLYEVLDEEDLGNGNAYVSALGFNISCGYLPTS